VQTSAVAAGDCSSASMVTSIKHKTRRREGGIYPFLWQFVGRGLGHLVVDPDRRKASLGDADVPDRQRPGLGLTDRRAHCPRRTTVSCPQRLAIFALDPRSQPVIAIIGAKGS
jgi:hypothetical protein